MPCFYLYKYNKYIANYLRTTIYVDEFIKTYGT